MPFDASARCNNMRCGHWSEIPLAHHHGKLMSNNLRLSLARCTHVS